MTFSNRTYLNMLLKRLLVSHTKSALCLSAIASAVLPTHIYFGTPLPIFPILVGLLAYPIAVVWTGSENRRLDLIFVILFSTTVAFLLAYGFPHPVGFKDVHRHLEFANAVGPKLAHGVIISNTFPALYGLTFTISRVSGLSIESSAQILTGSLFSMTIFLFYVLLTRRFLARSHSKLVATVLFAASWGVFRFMIEYRTLNISLAAGIFFLGVLVNTRWDHRWSICTILGIILLAISQFATFFFIVWIGFCYAVSRVPLNISQRTMYYLAIGGCSVIGFLLIIGTFDTFARGLIQIATQHFLPGGPNRARTPVENAASMPYGPRVYLLDWVKRGLVGVAAVTVTLLTAISRDRDHFFLVLAGGSVGVILSVAFVTGFALLPPRILTFFAIPAALIVGITIELVDNVPYRRLQRVGYGIAIFLIVISLSLSMVKLPGYIVGETQPLRGDAPVDDEGTFKISESDLHQAVFTESYVVRNVQDDRDRFIQYFYSPTEDPYYRFTTSAPNECQLVYDSSNSILVTCQ